MLSRVADSMYWMSRYLERAEHTARVLDINLHTSIDQSDRTVAVRRLPESMRTPGDNGPDPSTQEVSATSYQIVFDTKDPASIVSSIFSVRGNAREVREQISVEVWEEINRLYLSVISKDAGERWELEAHSFLTGVVQSARLIRGLTDATMSHSEGWQFIQLGQFIERVMNTVDLLSESFVNDSHGSRAAIPVEDYLKWVSLLKSCAVFGAYCRVYTVDVRAETVAEFLLLDPESPHSVRFGATLIGRALDAIATSTGLSKRSELHRISGKLISSLSFDRIDDIFRDNLHAYLSEIREQCSAIHTEVYNAFISYSADTAVRS